MNIKKLYWSNQEIIEKLKKSLNDNQISITSTDTILGFLGNISSRSFDFLNKLKGERSDKPYLILVKSRENIQNFVETTFSCKKLDNLLDKCWPGPLTVVFKAKNDLPNFLTSKENTIAIRCPKHDGLQEILKYFDGLFSTSANKSGKAVPKDIKDIDATVLEQIEYLVVDNQNNSDLSIDIEDSSYRILPSTIIDVSNKDEIKVKRQGAFSIKELENIYGEKFKKEE